MTPTPQETTLSGAEVMQPKLDGERVVISGMAGLYPQSHHVKDLADILYNKKNPITSDSLRYQYKHPEVVQYTGSIPGLGRFDAQFFKVHYRLGYSMDCMSKKILEQTYQAIYDAGINPIDLSGKKVGVYIGTCFSETEKACFYDADSRSGFGIAGCSKAMFANRISYWLNAKGPSMSIDEACCSSTAALEQAYLALSRGECEAAVVGGAFICLHPQSSVHYGRTLQLCADGKTKSFSHNADGCAKSEAINVLFLQKAKDALRIYANVLHAKSEFSGLMKTESGPKFGFFRNPTTTANFIKKFYEEANVPPQAVEYVEATGSANLDADKSELEAIDEVYCKNRSSPLLVGSVMSNIGYNEAASGISAVTKVLLGYHTGELAANMHCDQPRQDVPALRDGRLKVVTEHQKFGRTFVAVNGMSNTGVNSHILLHGHYKPKDVDRYKSDIPRLVTISARHEAAVKKILDDLKSRPVDPEELRLFHNLSQTSMTGHLGRGYVILDTNAEKKTISIAEKADYFNDARRQLWFVYSGMGSQWAGMGTHLMRIPIFAAAIERCHKVLQPRGLDIVHIITTPDKKIFDNILHSFVGIAAIQIGLTDILRELGLVPEGIIGHSVGELGCAYADGCLTAEEMILSAYSRGRVSLQTPFIRGSMAAVGLGYEQVITLCPPEIEVACHNGPESSTISGPADAMRAFVESLTAKGIFAREVPCSNIAYHSRYIAEAGPGLLKYLKEVIPDPKPRSKKWISSSVPQAKWDDPVAQLSSAEYHTNNLLSPVLFEETSRLIPNNAVLVEVAPHGLLQAILKRSLSPECVNIPLTRRNHTDNACMLLDAIGKLYMEGYNPKIHVLYPKIELPVSTGTPLLSHLVEWAHDEKWAVPLYITARRQVAASTKNIVSLFDREHSYLRGNVIKGVTLYPFAASLVAVWDTLAMTLNETKKQISVEFRDIQLYAQPPLHDNRQLRLSVTLHRSTGYFEVMEDNARVGSGYIVAKTSKTDKLNKNEIPKASGEMKLSADDVYQLFEERDYSYSGEFRSIIRASSTLDEADLVWSNNWVTLLDGIFQINALKQNHDSISTLTHIRRLCIDIDEHNNKGDGTLKAEVLETYDLTRCGGVLVENIVFENLPRIENNEIGMEQLKFVPNHLLNLKSSTSLQVHLQAIAENTKKDNINIVGLSAGVNDNYVFENVKHTVTNYQSLPGAKTITYKQLNLNNCDQFLADVSAVVVQNISIDDKLCQILHQKLPPDTFVISEEDLINDRVRPSNLYRVVASHNIEVTNGMRSRIDLIRWNPSNSTVATNVLTVRTSADLPYITSVWENLSLNHRLLIFSPYPAPYGLKELVQSWRMHNVRNNIYLIMADDLHTAMDQLRTLDLAYTVMRNGKWGGEYYIPIEENNKLSDNILLVNRKIGDYNSLSWIQAPEPVAPAGTKVTVEYAGIDSRDFRKANGTTPLNNESDNCYGVEFSGINESGQRVMGILPGGACAKRVTAIPELLWPVPAHWSLEDAATVPLAYLHAMYLLGFRGRFRPGVSVLIHDGTGAIGQAAIAIAFAHGCNVYTTVSDLRKKRFLSKLFPQLKVDNIGNSRDATFKDMILTTTSGKGCDLIISTLKGNLKNHNFGSCAFSGMIVDANQIPEREHYMFGFANLNKEKNYLTSDFDSVLYNKDDAELKKLQAMLSDGMARGYVRPLTRVSYAARDAPRAFQLLASNAHLGRVLLRMKDTVSNVLPRIIFNTEDTHVILGESALALHLADRLVARGARKLFIHSKQQSSVFQMKLRTWHQQGLDVETSSQNLDMEQKVNLLLNNAMRSGNIEGIYVTDVMEEAIISRLDLLSRKLCPNLRYFAVVSSNNTIGQDTCTARAENSLPATFLLLPAPNNELWPYKSAWQRFAVNAIERALCSSESVLIARKNPEISKSLLDQIEEIAGKSFSEKSSDDTTLEDLGIDKDKMSLIAKYLRVQCNISLDDTQLSLLTVEKILELQSIIKKSDLKPIEGLSTFFSYVDSDELLATTDMVLLPTLTTGASMRDDEFDVNQTHLCIVPGLEGLHERFHVLCERLKLPALVLQPGLENPHVTPREIAERYLEVLLKKAGIQDNFYLLGYESGAAIALEIAAMLEDQGMTGTIFCVGYAPDEFQEQLEEELKKYSTEEELQDAVMRHMFQLMAGNDTTVLDVALRDARSWSQKVDICVRTLLGKVSHSAQYARELIEVALARIQQTRKYQITKRALRSQLILLRAASQSPVNVAAFQQYSQKPVKVYQMRNSLAHIANDHQCPALINENLHKDLLEQFEVRNTCESYLLNANCFMGAAEQDT